MHISPDIQPFQICMISAGPRNSLLIIEVAEGPTIWRGQQFIFLFSFQFRQNLEGEGNLAPLGLLLPPPLTYGLKTGMGLLPRFTPF